MSFKKYFTIVFAWNCVSISSADVDATCDWISRGPLMTRNSTTQPKLQFPLVTSPDSYRNRFSSPDEVESQRLEGVIFEYIKSENVRDVILIHKVDSDDGLLLSELLYSHGVQVIHIEVQVVCEALKILGHYFSTLNSPNSADTLLISLEDSEEIDQLLMNISSKCVKSLVVGGFQKWQERLVEVRACEIHLIVITHCKESGQLVDSSPIQTDNSMYGSKCKERYTVWKSFLADEGSQKLRPVADWTNDSGWIKMTPEVDTITVRIALVQYLPFTSFTSLNGTVILRDCFLKGLLKHFSERLNLKFKLLNGQKWGGKTDTGWTGAIGMILRREADMIPYLPVTESRQSVLDFTKPIQFDKQGILVAYPVESSRVFVFFRLYQKEVWILLITSMITLSYILCKMLYFSTDSQKHTSLFQCFWSIYGFLFQQGATRLPSVDSARILLVTCWLSILVISATFSGNLVAVFSSSQNEYVVKSLEELSNHETIALAIKEDSPVYEEIQESQRALYQRIREVFLRDGHRLKIVVTNEDSVRILNDVAAGNAIYIGDIHDLGSLLRKDFVRNRDTCRITIAPDRFVTKELAFGLRKGSSLLQPLNEQIQKMTESGVFEAVERKMTLGAKPCWLGPPDQRPVKVGDLLGLFCILLLAYLFGCLILGVEVIGYKLKRNLRTQERVD